MKRALGPIESEEKLPKSHRARPNRSARLVSLRYLLDRLILGNRPMRRWSAEELAAEKTSLESLPIEAAKTETVSMRLVVYTVQRYLPATDARTEAEWREIQRRMRQRIRRCIIGKCKPEPRRGVDPEFSNWMDRTLDRGKYKDEAAKGTFTSDG